MEKKAVLVKKKNYLFRLKSMRIPLFFEYSVLYPN